MKRSIWLVGVGRRAGDRDAGAARRRGNSQQTKMTTCNADVKTQGLSGADRSAFMKKVPVGRLGAVQADEQSAGEDEELQYGCEDESAQGRRSQEVHERLPEGRFVILEFALIAVRPGSEAEFEKVFPAAEKVITASPGYLSHELRRSIETPNRFALLVQWRTLEDHTVGFRGSPAFAQWRALIGRSSSPRRWWSILRRLPGGNAWQPAGSRAEA